VTLIAEGPIVGYAATKGFTDCPCIEPDFASMEMPNRSECPDPAFPLPATVKGKIYCYPADYGSGFCKAHDTKLAPDCADGNGVPLSNAPNWCKDSWCYVNHATCGLTNAQSYVFPDVHGLWYAYSTCGNIDTFQASIVDDLEGKTIRMHVLNEPPMVYPDGGDKKGIVWELYDLMFDKAGVKPGNIVMQDLLPYNGSAWGACVRDVALGWVDLCLGTFWDLPERRAVANFVAPVLLDNFYLVVKQVDVKPDPIAQIFRVFDPFTPRLWVCIIVAISVISAAIYFLEEANQSDDHDDFPYDSKVLNVFESVYKGCMGFWSGGAAHSPQTMGSKVIMVAFGVFIVLTLAGYTANLASVLVVAKESQSTFKDVDDLLSGGHKLCIWSSVRPYFLQRQRSGDASQVIGVLNTAEAFAKLDAGECAGILNGERENNNYLTTEAHCNKMLAPSGAVFSLMLAQPATPLVARVMSYWVSKMKNELVNIEAKYETEDECAATSDTEEVSEADSKKLDLEDFAGTFALTGAASAFGFILAGLNCLFAKTKKEINRMTHHDNPEAAGEQQGEAEKAESGELDEAAAHREHLAKAHKAFLARCQQVQLALEQHMEEIQAHTREQVAAI